MDKFDKLKQFLSRRFNWEIPESDSEEQDHEDAPTIVEM